VKSVTDAFEDAEIAREEARSMAAVIMYSASGIDLDAASSGTPEAISACRVADALISLGYSRQSPASTTAADAPDDVESIREDVMIALTKAGYDLSGTDHSQPNEIEVGGDDVEFRLTITEL